METIVSCLKQKVDRGLEKAAACSHEILEKAASSNILAVKVWEWLPLIMLEGVNLPRVLGAELFQKTYHALKTCSGATPTEIIHITRFQRLYGKEILANGDILNALRSMQQPDGGWNENPRCGISSIPTTCFVLNFLSAFNRGTDFDSVRQQGEDRLLLLWEDDLARDGLAFKNAQCLSMMAECARRGLVSIDRVSRSIGKAIAHLEKQQSHMGSWGSFYPMLAGCDLDLHLASVLTTAVATHAIIHTTLVGGDPDHVQRLQALAEKGVTFIVSQQHETGFWFADSGACFLKTLGWGIKVYQSFRKAATK